jgi:hypothetical protein
MWAMLRIEVSMEKRREEVLAPLQLQFAGNRRTGPSSSPYFGPLYTTSNRIWSGDLNMAE